MQVHTTLQAGELRTTLLPFELLCTAIAESLMQVLNGYRTSTLASLLSATYNAPGACSTLPS